MLKDDWNHVHPDPDMSVARHAMRMPAGEPSWNLPSPVQVSRQWACTASIHSNHFRFLGHCACRPSSPSLKLSVFLLFPKSWPFTGSEWRRWSTCSGGLAWSCGAGCMGAWSLPSLLHVSFPRFFSLDIWFLGFNSSLINNVPTLVLALLDRTLAQASWCQNLLCNWNWGSFLLGHVDLKLIWMLIAQSLLIDIIPPLYPQLDKENSQKPRWMGEGCKIVRFKWYGFREFVEKPQEPHHDWATQLSINSQYREAFSRNVGVGPRVPQVRQLVWTCLWSFASNMCWRFDTKSCIWASWHSKRGSDTLHFRFSSDAPLEGQQSCNN